MPAALLRLFRVQSVSLICRTGPIGLIGLLYCGLAIVAAATASGADDPPAAPTLILHHGKIATVDDKFTIAQAVAVSGEKIVAVGSDDDVLKLKGDKTELVDLAGRLVVPGLIDSHSHPTGACMTEFDHPIGELQTIDDVLKYIQARAETLGEGKWVEVRQVFITRLREQRYPTRAEMDRVAPNNPVLFATGPDASLNSLALKLSGIDKDYVLTGHGVIEKDPATGEPTGILRSCTRIVKSKPSDTKKVTEEDRLQRLVELFLDYNSVGITAIADRDSNASSVERFQALAKSRQLTVRISASEHLDTEGDLDKIAEQAQKIAASPRHCDDPWVKTVGVKTYLDGGMLTGSAYMRQPWGVSRIYSITDPAYRGVLFVPRERLLPIVRATLETGLQFTAHSVGDGAVHQLLDVYAEIDKTIPVKALRPCVTHSNFMSREAVEQAAKLGVVLDIQPVWLYLDGKTLTDQFGIGRLRYFQPLSSIFKAGGIVGGGSDHMQKIGSLRSINPYNPFLGMATAVTRLPRGVSEPLHIEEALTREQMLRFYTSNNAYILFREREIGSLEPGKLADLAVLDTDLLTCPPEKIAQTKALTTWVNGKQVYPRPSPGT